MDDEARKQLAEKLDKDLLEMIEEKSKKSKGHDWEYGYDPNKSVDEIYEELQQHPAFMKEFDPSKPMSPAMEALMMIKYNPDDAEEKADSYKDDGNYNFKLKKYRWAIDNYTEAIRSLSPNREQNAILYCNRAAAHFRLKNYRSAWKDSMVSLTFKPDHLKAFVKGSLSCIEMGRYNEAVEISDAGLSRFPDDKLLLENRVKAEQLKKKYEREIRQEKAKQKKKEQEEKQLIELIKKCGVKLANESVDNLTMSSLEARHPSGAKVFKDASGDLNWPVLLLYPEYQETDLIEAFNEKSTFNDHLNCIFATAAPWDRDHKYSTLNVNVYFEDKEKEQLFVVNKGEALRTILQHPKFIVEGGTPAFVILVDDSDFGKQFLSRYKS